MKKTIALMSVLAFIALGGHAQKLRICCVGNSITYGYGMKDRAHDSYPARLQSMLGSGVEVMNAGYNSRTMLLKGDHPYMKETLFQEALAFAPDIVVIKLGTNDSKPQNWVHGEEFVHDMTLLVDSFLHLDSSPEVYLCLPVPATGNHWGITDSVIVNCVIPSIRQVARSRHLRLIDLHKSMEHQLQLISSDQVHPTREGYAHIASCVGSFLKKKSKKLRRFMKKQ